jgi:hypothetical protein
MCNPGIKERDDPRMVGAWTAGTGLFHLYRSQGAPILAAAMNAQTVGTSPFRSSTRVWNNDCRRLVRTRQS